MNEPEARHRLAAIMAADAAGYSHAMADDDRVALATLDAARTVFRRHIEAAYREMWERHLRGEAPAAIVVDAVR